MESDCIVSAEPSDKKTKTPGKDKVIYDVTNCYFRWGRAKWLILTGNKYIKSIKTVKLSFEFSNAWLVQCVSLESIP